MANKITNEEIVQINILYKKLGTYSGVAKETGRSPATVKKYIIPDFEIPEAENKIVFTQDMYPQELDMSAFLSTNNFGTLCILSDEEKDEIKELWKELVI